MTRKASIALVGPGNLGTSLALALHAAGYGIDEIVSRTLSRRARALARRVAAPARTWKDSAFAADIVWLCVPDDAIADAARRLAARGSWRGRICLHSSGALSSGLLRPLARRGAAVATLHPMQSFVRSAPAPMKGLWFGVEGSPAAARVARRIARDLGGKTLAIDRRDKALYHALGSFSSPMLVAVLALADEIARAARIPARARRGLTEPILRRTLENYFRHGAAAAFRGPLVRGDVTTVRAHLAALRRVPGALDVYKALVRSALLNLPAGKKKEIAKLVGE